MRTFLLIKRDAWNGLVTDWLSAPASSELVEGMMTPSMGVRILKVFLW